MTARTIHPQGTAATGITIENLSKVFPPSAGSRTAAAVDGISLTIEAGELFFLLGPSGCGKTTLLRMIAGFIEPTSGRVLFDRHGVREDVTYLAANQRNTGMVFQSYALWPHMTVFDNVAFGLDVRRVSGEERTRRVLQALESVQMAEFAGRKPTQLSGGQQQRVALARAMVIRPSVLLLDEPLSNLDAKLRIELRSEIRTLCKASGMTTVYVTHDQKEALSMADRIAILRAGRVIQAGTPEALYQAPETDFVAEFLGDTNFVSGLIADLNATTVLVKSAIGALTAVVKRQDKLKLGQKVLLCIRPEAIQLGSSNGSNVLRARIVDEMYLGDSTQVSLETAGMRLKATLRASGASSPRSADGDAVLQVDPEDVIVLPA